ncbi:sugar-binding protein [Bacteroidota bacterium]
MIRYPMWPKFKKILFSLFTISLTTLPVIIFAQENLTIYSTDNAPVIDGIIEGVWNDYPSQSLDNILSGTISSDADFSAEYRVIWDNSAIYILVDITDDTKINDSEGTVWQDDAVEIYIDVNNDKLTSYGETDFQYSFRHNDAAIYGGYNSAGITFAEGNKTGGYVMEIQIPWATIGLLSAESGQLHGFDVHVHDDDDGGDRDAKLAWYTTVDESWGNPSLFATAKLYGTFVEVYRAERPLFSVPHGFYTEAFDLYITSAIPEAQIYYTLDGSDPRSSTTATISSSPAIVRIDPTSSTGRGITPAFVVRASVIKDGYDFSRIETQTYIFVHQVRIQSDDPGHDWPTYDINGQEISLHVNQDVVNDERYTDLLDEALTEIPSYSLVTDNSNLWDPDKGIYVNALEHGIAWERPASVELIYPDGSEGFQIDAGVRIRGGYSRNDPFPKHAFRLFFRNIYGAGKLNYPLFITS